VRDWRNILLDIKDVQRDNFAYKIWLIENAYHILESDDYEGLQAIDQQARSIANEDICIAVLQVTSDLEQANSILSYVADLSSEEWLLVMSHISSAHCVQKFIGKIGRKFDNISLAEAMSKSRKILSDLPPSAYEAGLRNLRRNYPNPLPAWLDRP
jgi:hypothetical protein